MRRHRVGRAPAGRAGARAAQPRLLARRRLALPLRRAALACWRTCWLCAVAERWRITSVRDCGGRGEFGWFAAAGAPGALCRSCRMSGRWPWTCPEPIPVTGLDCAAASPGIARAAATIIAPNPRIAPSPVSFDDGTLPSLDNS
jgi:hypothetical protein